MSYYKTFRTVASDVWQLDTSDEFKISFIKFEEMFLFVKVTAKNHFYFYKGKYTFRFNAKNLIYFEQ